MTVFRAAFCAMGALCSLALIAPAASAQDKQDKEHARFGVAVTGGTLGIGPELSAGLTENLGLRANATFLSVSGDFATSDLDYDGTAKLRSAGLMIDLFPTGGGFHISAGVRTNGNRAEMVATPNRSVTIGNTTYTPAQIGTITGNADVRGVAPQLTLGYRKRSGGLTVGVEAGALFQGRVNINQFQSSTGLIARADLDRERNALQGDVDKYEVYPVVQLSLGWRF